MTAVSYVDASALVKLVVDEPESVELQRWYVEGERVLSSVVGMIETRRAVNRRSHDGAHLEHVLGAIEFIEISKAIADRAASIPPAAVRTLDAIHLATALTLQPGLEAFVTYDDRLAEAARALGLPVVSPA